MRLLPIVLLAVAAFPSGARAESYDGNHFWLGAGRMWYYERDRTELASYYFHGGVGGRTAIVHVLHMPEASETRYIFSSGQDEEVQLGHTSAYVGVRMGAGMTFSMGGGRTTTRGGYCRRRTGNEDCGYNELMAMFGWQHMWGPVGLQTFINGGLGGGFGAGIGLQFGNNPKARLIARANALERARLWSAGTRVALHPGSAIRPRPTRDGGKLPYEGEGVELVRRTENADGAWWFVKWETGQGWALESDIEGVPEGFDEFEER